MGFSARRRAWVATGVMLCCAGAAAAGTPAARANGWTPPITLARVANEVPRLELAVNSQGDALALWVRQRLVDGACCDDQRVVASFRPAGGRFGRALPISPLGVQATDPSASLGEDGSAVVAWTVDDTAASLGFAPGGVQATYRPPGGRFGPPRTLTSPGHPGQDSAAAITTNGEALVLWDEWRQADPFTPVVVMAASRAAGGRFGRPERVSGDNRRLTARSAPQSDDMWPQVVPGAHGEAFAAWSRTQPGSNVCCRAIEASQRPPGGHFDAPRVVSTPSRGATAANLAFGAGQLAISWVRRQGGDELCCYRAETRIGASVDSLGAVEDLGAVGENDNWVIQKIASTGKRVVLVGRGYGLVSMHADAGGPFSAPQTLNDDIGGASLATRGGDGFVAAWTPCGSCEEQAIPAQAAVTIPEGSFGPPEYIATDRDWAVVGSDDHGGTLALLTGAGAVEASGYDGTDPGAGPPRSSRVPRIDRLRFVRRRTPGFTFRLSEAGDVALRLERYDDTSYPEGGGRLLVVLRAHGHRGFNRVRLPRRFRRLRGRYVASPIVQNAAGNDSPWIRPPVFRIVPR